MKNLPSVPARPEALSPRRSSLPPVPPPSPRKSVPFVSRVLPSSQPFGCVKKLQF